MITKITRNQYKGEDYSRGDFCIQDTSFSIEKVFQLFQYVYILTNFLNSNGK